MDPDIVPDWLLGEPDRLLAFAASAEHPDGGFAWLDDTGVPATQRPVQTWVNCRMTHVFALGLAAGRTELRGSVEHGIAALNGLLRDEVYGGWYDSATADGPVEDAKQAYTHAFVLLAAASADMAGAAGARALLEDALAVHDRRFWDEDAGMVVDVYNRDWSELERYRGVNANMHTVEALLAAADATGDRKRAERAARVVERVVHGFARAHGWRLPEHFDEHWGELLDYNRDQPAHPFRPYGVTIGHLFEWARLAMHLRHTLGAEAPAWLLEDARALFDRGVADGWSVDGAPGFVYTTDFDGTPLVRTRLHWVAAEAIAAAWTLYRATDEPGYAQWLGRWCDYAAEYFVDTERGSWHHELDEHNHPADTVWQGKPDIYHVFQAGLLPRLPECASLAAGVLALNRS